VEPIRNQSKRLGHIELSRYESYAACIPCAPSQSYDGLVRLPAKELETLVLKKVREVLESPAKLIDVLGLSEESAAAFEPELRKRQTQVDGSLLYHHIRMANFNVVLKCIWSKGVMGFRHAGWPFLTGWARQFAEI
jgi:hypothetical protein